MQHLPHIRSIVIPSICQNYPTAGDYENAGSEKYPFWKIKIAQMPDWRHEALLLIHELTEMLLTAHDGIDWKDITEWDTLGAGKDSDDPGALPDAPYHRQHMKAEQIEKQLAEWLGVDWAEYNTALDALEYK